VRSREFGFFIADGEKIDGDPHDDLRIRPFPAEYKFFVRNYFLIDTALFLESSCLSNPAPNRKQD